MDHEKEIKELIKSEMISWHLYHDMFDIEEFDIHMKQMLIRSGLVKKDMFFTLIMDSGSKQSFQTIALGVEVCNSYSNLVRVFDYNMIRLNLHNNNKLRII